MFTTDLALRFDPEYQKITSHWLENPEEFELAFAKAWFKLTHRDMGPRARYIGADVPAEELMWQDPVPAVDHDLVEAGDIAALKAEILDSGPTVSELVRTAWASAASFRATDLRGGANGARIALAPQKDWDVNNPKELAKVLKALKGIQKDFNRGQSGDKRVSLADLIVLGGAAAIEKAAKDAGHDVQVPFMPGRADASQDQTDVSSFAVLEPTADGFRNYFGDGNYRSPAEMLVDRANLLTLTVPEMTVLVGGMRVLDANVGGSDHGVFTDQPGALSNDFFVNLLSMSTAWKKSSTAEGIYEGHDRTSGDLRWTATPVDLVFGSHAELRAIAEVYAENGGEAKFINDFVSAWTKVMTLDRFDIS
jgi:catalase-peroxidase